MSEKKIESDIRGMVQAFAKGDVKKALSFFAEDAVWVAPEGTFKGKEELKRYMTWAVQGTSDRKFGDAGIGMMVKENKVVWEHVEEGGTSEGMKWEVPVICMYEFGDEKIQQHRAVYDRLSIAKQVVKGTVAKKGGGRSREALGTGIALVFFARYSGNWTARASSQYYFKKAPLRNERSGDILQSERHLWFLSF